MADLRRRHPGCKDRFGPLQERLAALAGTELVASPMSLPLTAPIHRNAVNLRYAGGERFQLALRTLEEQVANLQRRAGDWELGLFR